MSRCVKGKGGHAPVGHRWDAYLAHTGLRASRWIDHWVCDAWPVRRQTYGYLPSHRASPSRRPLASTILYCLVTEAHGCEWLAQSCYSAMWRPGVELTISRLRVNALTSLLLSHFQMFADDIVSHFQFNIVLKFSWLLERNDCLFLTCESNLDFQQLWVEFIVGNRSVGLWVEFIVGYQSVGLWVEFIVGYRIVGLWVEFIVGYRSVGLVVMSCDPRSRRQWLCISDVSLVAESHNYIMSVLLSRL